MTTSGDPAPLARRLHELDAEMDRVRRRMFAVKTGLEPVADPSSEMTRLQSRFDELSQEFVETYRRWQSAERNLEPS